MMNESTSKAGSSTVETVETPHKHSDAIEQFTKSGMQTLMELIKASNNLPIEQWDFFKTFPAFNGLMQPESKKILEMLNSMLQHQLIRGNVLRRDDDEKYEMIIEANDAILERVDSNLDELQGLKKNPEPIVGEVRAVNRRQGPLSLTQRVSNNSSYQTTIRSLVTTRLNVRPQIKFKDKIDNRNLPFEPRIKEKPNALKPLAILLEKYDDKGESFSHPYEYELDMFKPCEGQLRMCEPQQPKLLNEVPLVYVSDVETLNQMMEHLKKKKEIAVDVEHHSYRSFQGFTCLIQISTREMDYIVDALELRHELHVLNDVFTDPKVIKVLHGAEHDIEWLQRDLCVYIVNMFDTHQAAQVLDFPRLSLAHLLKVFCNINSNKQFQLFDWRTRPLPEEAMKYAREDTHYLLYVYDKLKNALIEKAQNKTNVLESVMNRSNELCKRKYWKDIFTDDSHLEFYRRSKKMFDNRQMYALQHLYHWRDKIAREEDESIMYVLPNHMLLNIAEALPREIQGISALCNPVPPLVKQHEREIHKIVFKAREQSLVKPIIEGDNLNQSLEVQPNWVPVNVDSKLFCPHDLSHCDDDIRDDLPTLLQRNLTTPSLDALKNNKFSDTAAAAVDVLCNESENDGCELNACLLKDKERHWKFVSPYQRYQKVIAFVQTEESKTNEVKTELQEEIPNDDRPSPAKIPKLGPNICNADAEKGNSNNNATADAVQASIHSNNCKKKKKKKKRDGNISDASSLNDTVVNRRKIEVFSETAGDVDTVISTEVNDTVIPDLLEEGEILDTPVIQRQDKKITNKNKKKKSDDCGDTENTIDKKRAKTNDDFQPYNYNAVDFSRFESSTSKQNNKKKKKNNNSGSGVKPQGRRTPWLGNKKNNSVKNTIKNLTK